MAGFHHNHWSVSNFDGQDLFFQILIRLISTNIPSHYINSGSFIIYDQDYYHCIKQNHHLPCSCLFFFFRLHLPNSRIENLGHYTVRICWQKVSNFYYTHRRITHLYNLTTDSQTKSHAATIVANNFRGKGYEYRAQGTSF